MSTESSGKPDAGKLARPVWGWGRGATPRPTPPEGRQGGPLNPQALSLEDVARILTASGWKPVTVDMVRDDIDDGAPTNADGTINLIHYAAWLVKEMAGGD